MFGFSEIYEALNISAITTLIDNPIVNGPLLPQDYTGSSINVYHSTDSGPSEEYENYNFTINCRSYDFIDSQTIARTVIDEISRKFQNKYFIYCNLLPTIPPADDRDNFNTPVQANIKIRG